MAIEEEFSIEIPDKDADAIHSGELLSIHNSYEDAWLLTPSAYHSGQGCRVHLEPTRCQLIPSRLVY
jgi:hypothetical protein